MNDIKTRNCLSSKMVDSLIYCIENASKLSTNKCRVLIINSNRESNTFCSGHNLKELLSQQIHKMKMNGNIILLCTQIYYYQYKIVDYQ